MLRVVPADRPLVMLDLLRDALDGRGDALLPVFSPVPDLAVYRASSAVTRPARLARNGAPGAHVPVAASVSPVPSPVPATVPATVPDGTAVVIETSGSTGVPKRVLLGAAALRASAAASSAALGGPGQWLLALPVHYVAGVQVLVRSLSAGTTPIVLAPGHFDPAAFFAAASRLTAPLRYTSLVPVQLARLLDAVDAAGAADQDAAGESLALLRRFTAILVGGQAMPPELLARAASLGITVVRTYGSSETAGGCCYNGRPIGDTVVRVVAGELEISGSVLADGYLDDPLRTRDRFTEENGVRWYRTGDLGEVDAVTGLVRVLGRADNVIISGGEKVSLDAVERVVRGLPGFSAAVVVGATDARWGQVPVVAIPAAHDTVPSWSGGEASPRSRTAVPSSSPEADTAQLAVVMEAVASALGKAARPNRLLLVAEIPVLASGKPDRRALQRLAEAGS
ncbi:MULTISPECIES: AMP-binding protein [unclassified Cryobacterium]|uniref:AMP-binding protein n=1 Tax=unclassified Cryobacterium TaxID=2649013 RepID=UPI002AB3DC88|nr:MULTISPECIES: AMP-binding protein [unclassified Cryobacterium]MDY7541860.1 AMP-binding protein [Cryobacterium sp. 5B3]MEB0000940.1 AMP-binding protein [Cryobacterium sp. RTS3]MEB0266035.1 AMP-binding protein [Cryobacterium sp. 10I5]MEB0274210.1 AMP-binding protein [Cryobacterium sp. 5B3]